MKFKWVYLNDLVWFSKIFILFDIYIGNGGSLQVLLLS